LELLVSRGFDRLVGKSEDGAFHLTQAVGCGKTHSLVAFLAWNKWFNPLPLSASQRPPNQDRRPQLRS
jgi:hypothetical protein